MTESSFFSAGRQSRRWTLSDLSTARTGGSVCFHRSRGNGEGQEWLEAARAFKQSAYRSAHLSKKQALLLLIATAVAVCDKILLCKCGWGLVPLSLGGQTAHTPVASVMMPPASDVIVFSLSWQESPDARLLLKQSRQLEMTETEKVTEKKNTKWKKKKRRSFCLRFVLTKRKVH